MGVTGGVQERGRRHVTMEPTERVTRRENLQSWLSLYMSTHLHCVHTFRGLLTGKFHRGQPPPDPSSSRVAWVEADKQSRTNQSHPNLSEYADKEQFWELLDVMRQIADSHGKRGCVDIVGYQSCLYPRLLILPAPSPVLSPLLSN